MDYWHFLAERLFNKNEKIYWSTTVMEESERKINDLIEIYNGFFDKISQSLLDEFISKENFIEIAKNIKRVKSKNKI